MQTLWYSSIPRGNTYFWTLSTADILANEVTETWELGKQKQKTDVRFHLPGPIPSLSVALRQHAPVHICGFLKKMLLLIL